MCVNKKLEQENPCKQRYRDERLLPEMAQHHLGFRKKPSDQTRAFPGEALGRLAAVWMGYCEKK